jgi:hypothetical protein
MSFLRTARICFAFRLCFAFCLGFANYAKAADADHKERSVSVVERKRAQNTKGSKSKKKEPTFDQSSLYSSKIEEKLIRNRRHHKTRRNTAIDNHPISAQRKCPLCRQQGRSRPDPVFRSTLDAAAHLQDVEIATLQADLRRVTQRLETAYARNERLAAGLFAEPFDPAGPCAVYRPCGR